MIFGGKNNCIFSHVISLCVLKPPPYPTCCPRCLNTMLHMKCSRYCLLFFKISWNQMIFQAVATPPSNHFIRLQSVSSLSISKLLAERYDQNLHLSFTSCCAPKAINSMLSSSETMPARRAAVNTFSDFAHYSLCCDESLISATGFLKGLLYLKKVGDFVASVYAKPKENSCCNNASSF